ncbi:MAG TPA: hypothetical protein VI230_09180, partial [Ignavibacteriaceae bacterium]
MVTQSDFRLLDDLYANLAVLDSNLRPVFVGKALLKLLSEKKHYFDFSDTASASESAWTARIIEAAALIKKTGLSETIIFSDMNNEFVLVPGSDGSFYFGLKSKILCFISTDHNLKERNKELECLFGISKESDSIQEFDAFLEKCTGL